MLDAGPVLMLCREDESAVVGGVVEGGEYSGFHYFPELFAGSSEDFGVSNVVWGDSLPWGVGGEGGETRACGGGRVRALGLVL